MTKLDPDPLQIGWFVLVLGDAAEYIVERITTTEARTTYDLKPRHDGKEGRKAVDWKEIVAVSRTPFIVSVADK